MIDQATLATCVLQVTCIAAATLVLSCCMRRLAANCRMNLPLTGLLLVLALTLLAPVPWTKWWAALRGTHACLHSWHCAWIRFIVLRGREIFRSPQSCRCFPVHS